MTTLAQGPTTLRPSSQWNPTPSASLNHLHPSQVTNFRPCSVAPRRPIIQTHPDILSDFPRLASRHVPNPKAQVVTAVPSSAAVSAVVETKLCQTLETAFKVFNDRFHKDMRDFQTVCAKVIVRETQEKDRWQNLYLQAARERDQARQELQESARRVSKRSRDSCDDRQENINSTTSPTAQESMARPIRNMRLSPTSTSSPPFPTHSPLPTSATSSVGSYSHSPFTSPSPSFPPSSATSSNDNSDEAVTSHMISRFYDFGATHHSLEETAPQPKRRKSLDFSAPNASVLTSTNVPTRPRTHSPHRVVYTVNAEPADMWVKREPEDMEDFLAADFVHVDIMYLRKGDRLVCRACCLSQSKQTVPASTEPTSYSLMTSWDDLKYHVVKNHPAECGDVARLHAAEIFELRRRIQYST